jgi:hypothetical protein
MKLNRLCRVAILIIVAALMVTATGCFNNYGLNNGSSATPTVVKPRPLIESVVATTSGTKTAYFATLDIKAKNEGAEGTILVTASVTQNGTTNNNEMEVFLKQGESHELKMTFPLVWGGGDFSSNVQAVVP